MGEIKKLHKKPEWFDLTKYDSLSELRSGSWHHKLQERSYLYRWKSWGSAGNINDPEKVGFIFRKRLSTFLDDIKLSGILKQTPILEESAFEKLIIDNIDEWAENEDTNMFYAGVTPLTYSDFQRLQEQDVYEIASILKTRLDYLDEGGSKSIDAIAHKNNSFRPDRLHMKINFRYTDEVLVQNFLSFLSAARKNYSSNEGGLKKSIFKRLIKARVILYIDLTIWARQSGIVIPQHVMGDWLFPDEQVDVAEKIRKVTIPLVNRSLGAEFISAIGSVPNDRKKMSWKMIRKIIKDKNKTK